MPHASTESLQEVLDHAALHVKVGGRYRHYRSGGTYTVIALALDEENEQPCIVYRSERHGLTWIRTLADWEAEVPGPQGTSVRRFEPV